MARTRSTSASKPRATAKPKVEEPKAETLGDAAETPTAQPEAPKQKKQRAVSDENQTVVDRILTMRREGKGLPTIANTLNEEGVKPFGKGVKWYPPVVRGICLRHGVEKGEKTTDSAAA